MTETKLWKIIHHETSGWNDIEERFCTKLNKEQCQKRLEELIAKEGYNPNHLKAVPDA
tara:strand:+ start:303 stop:476 length:174 start_codon:yes stop_codon:yes gene_type:complete